MQLQNNNHKLNIASKYLSTPLPRALFYYYSVVAAAEEFMLWTQIAHSLLTLPGQSHMLKSASLIQTKTIQNKFVSDRRICQRR